MAFVPLAFQRLGNSTTCYHRVNTQYHFFCDFCKILLWDDRGEIVIQEEAIAYDARRIKDVTNKYFRRPADFFTTACERASRARFKKRASFWRGSNCHMAKPIQMDKMSIRKEK
jgi:hypothetical protein